MKKNSLESFFLRNWYGKSRWTLLLLPFNIIFVLLAHFRRCWLIQFKQRTPTIPLVIVGNISVGGTGKTPLIIALVKKLQAEGFAPAVISRGYGSLAKEYPYTITHQSTVIEAGDEPFSIFQRTQCPVVIGANRFDSISSVRNQNVDLVLSDDGLQDYRLGRHMEIAVIDGQRWFGNGWRLPVGPLREAVSRLSSVDMLVVNNPSEHSLTSERSLTSEHALKNAPVVNFHSMQIKPCYWVNIKTNEILALDAFPHTNFHAVAGIGNPQRFYQTLKQLELDFIEHDFPDHHDYGAADFYFAGETAVVMTEKDAVKCQSFAKHNWYYLAVEAELDDRFWQEFMQKVKSIRIQKYTGKILHSNLAP
jgi:tetraacyldisaccharide 4'-kinase